MALPEPTVVLAALPVPEDAMKEGRLPLVFTAHIHGRMLEFEIAYNDFAHFFTLRIRSDGRDLVSGALMYGVDFCKPFQHIAELRGLRLVPFDMALKHSVITPENFGREVRLYYYSEREWRA